MTETGVFLCLAVGPLGFFFGAHFRRPRCEPRGTPPRAPRPATMVRSPLRGALSASQSVEVKPDTAEVVFLGEILGATGRGLVRARRSDVSMAGCPRGALEPGARERGGATQASEPSAHGGELAAWSHPLQMQFSTTSVQVSERARGVFPSLYFAVGDIPPATASREILRRN